MITARPKNSKPQVPVFEAHGVLKKLPLPIEPGRLF
jgi:hypothetical protein